MCYKEEDLESGCENVSDLLRIIFHINFLGVDDRYITASADDVIVREFKYALVYKTILDGS